MTGAFIRKTWIIFSEKMQEIADLGVNIIGGCCGTTPEYIRRLCGTVNLSEPVVRRRFGNRAALAFGSTAATSERTAEVSERAASASGSAAAVSGSARRPCRRLTDEKIGFCIAGSGAKSQRRQ